MIVGRNFFKINANIGTAPLPPSIEEEEKPFGPAAGEQIRLWTYLREKHS
jgi:hypothetical protein